jgi:hypothetical protein
MSVTAASCRCGSFFHRGLHQAYSQEAFTYLLDKARRRAECAGRPILLLLVSLRGKPGASARMSPALAASIFCGFSACVRDIDLPGWFREDRVAGVILPQGRESLEEDVPRRIGERAGRMLLVHVPPEAARRLQIRVLQLRCTSKVRLR